MPKLYGESDDGNVMEVQNRDRRCGDVLVMQSLSDQQVQQVKKLKADGRSDTQIWRALHPERGLESNASATREFALALEELTKAQLILLIEKSIDFKADSLEKMKREDLIRLIRHFGHDRKPTRVTLTP